MREYDFSGLDDPTLAAMQRRVRETGEDVEFLTAILAELGARHQALWEPQQAPLRLALYMDPLGHYLYLRGRGYAPRNAAISTVTSFAPDKDVLHQKVCRLVRVLEGIEARKALEGDADYPTVSGTVRNIDTSMFAEGEWIEARKVQDGNDE